MLDRADELSYIWRVLKFYVYELVIVPDNKVCYVGKGSGRRMWNHRKYVRQVPSVTQLYLYRKLSELLANGKDFEPRKVFETEDESKALAEEKRRINVYGLDNLFNCSDCRTGPSLVQIETATRLAQSRSRREYVANLRKIYGYGMPPEVVAKIAKVNRGRKRTPVMICKIKAAWKANPKNIEQARQQALRLSIENVGRKQTPEHIEKAHLPLRGQKRTLAQCAAIANGLAGGAARPRAKSKYRGAEWLRHKKAWQSRIKVGGERKFIGQFKLDIDAGWAYDNVFEKYYGWRPNGTDPQHKITRFKLGKHGLLIPVDKI